MKKEVLVSDQDGALVDFSSDTEFVGGAISHLVISRKCHMVWCMMGSGA